MLSSVNFRLTPYESETDDAAGCTAIGRSRVAINGVHVRIAAARLGLLGLLPGELDPSLMGRPKSPGIYMDQGKVIN
jgi:hypothetical protein